MSDPTVRRGAAAHPDPATAVAELAAQIAQPDSTTFVFASSRYDSVALAEALRAHFPGPRVGCTTSGELTPDGYATGGLVGFTLPRALAEVKTYPIAPLDALGPIELGQVGACAQADFEARPDPEARAFGLLFVDGLSLREEAVMGHVATAMPSIPVVGGSAGDDFHQRETHVLVDGEFRTGAAMLTVVRTTLPFSTFKSQHYEPTSTKLVITSAEPERRYVRRIDGRPAAEAYAETIGCSVSELTEERFGAHPLMLRAGGEYYVRSIRRVEPDGGLSFYCAIDEGLVLTVGHGTDILGTLQRDLGAASTGLPGPHLVLGFECIYRRLEVERRGLVEDMNAVIRTWGVLGFHSYGEQTQHLHVNQTFTGVVLGSGA